MRAPAPAPRIPAARAASPLAARRRVVRPGRTPRPGPTLARIASAARRVALAALATLLPVGTVPTALAQDGPDFPALSGRVVDGAGLLDPAAEGALDAALAAHETASGDQVVVVTVPSLDGYDIADYANRLGRHWGIGTAENDNGVLLLVAPQEREVRIEVGYGLEGALTDALSSTIIRREILPRFRDGDYPGGIEAGTRAIIDTIEGEYTAAPGATDGAADGRRDGGVEGAIGNFLPLIFLAMIAVPHALRRGGARRLAGGAFPAGFAGLMGTLFSGSLLIGIVIAIAVFAFVYLNGSGGGGGGGGTRRRRRRRGIVVGGGGFGGGFGGGLGGGGFGGGGFGGGGGSFGGGGASGSW